MKHSRFKVLVWVGAVSAGGLALACSDATGSANAGGAGQSNTGGASSAGTANTAGAMNAGAAGAATGGGNGGVGGSLGGSAAGGSANLGGSATAGGGVAGTAGASGGAGGTAGAGPRVVILTYNDRTATANGEDAKIGNDWPHRLPLAKQMLTDVDPDAFGIQEATDGQVSDLTPGYRVLREAEVAIFYRADRLEALDGGSMKLGVFGNPDPWGDRWVLWQRFRPVFGTKTFYLFVTHLSTAGDNVPQAKQVFDAATAKAADGTPTVVIGDFNYDAAGTLLGAGFSDAVSDHLGTFHAFAGGRGGPRFDFIGTKHFTSIESQVYTHADTSHSPPVYPSDHYPVWARLQLSP